LRRFHSKRLGFNKRFVVKTDNVYLSGVCCTQTGSTGPNRRPQPVRTRDTTHGCLFVVWGVLRKSKVWFCTVQTILHLKLKRNDENSSYPASYRVGFTVGLGIGTATIICLQNCPTLQD